MNDPIRCPLTGCIFVFLSFAFFVSIQNTYNPLGQTLTFLTIEDIATGVHHLLD